MKCFGITDTGKKRINNQDCFAIRELSDSCYLIAVCDGMGGANGGEVASSKAIEVFFDSCTRDITPESTDDEIKDALFDAVAAANREVFALAEYSEELRGMGTTIVSALVRDNGCDLDSIDHDVKTYAPNGEAPEVPAADPCVGIFLAHVGDSRAYLSNAEELRQLTKDHSYVQYLVDMGELRPEKAENHPQKNIIMKAIGAECTVMPDVDKVLVTDKENTYVLLSSDGLHGELRQNEIRKIIHSDKTIEEKCEELIALANKKGGHDNITAILLEL